MKLVKTWFYVCKHIIISLVKLAKNSVITFSRTFLIEFISYLLAGNDDIHKSLNELKFGEIRPWTTELAALERLKKIPYSLIMEKKSSSHFLCYFSSDPFHTCRQ